MIIGKKKTSVASEAEREQIKVKQDAIPLTKMSLVLKDKKVTFSSPVCALRQLPF